MVAHVKRLVDQGFCLPHFDPEQILAKYPEVDTVWFLGELNRLGLINEKANVQALSNVLNRFTIWCVVHQLEEIFLCFIVAIRISHLCIVLDILR